MQSCHHKQPVWQGVPRLLRGALSPTGSRRVVLRANFDSGFDSAEDDAMNKADDLTSGFSLVLAAAKAYLEHGIDLNIVADRF